MCTFQFAAQPQQADEHPEKVVGGSEGPEATHPARARPRSWTCSFVMTDALGWQQSIQPSPSDQVCIHQPFPRWVKYHHNAYCLYSSSKKVFQWNISSWVNILYSFYVWEDEGTESWSGLITYEMNAGLLIPIPLSLENPRSIKSSQNHRAILHYICSQSCLKSSRSYLLSEWYCIFFISTAPHQEKPIEKHTFGHKKFI